MPKVYRRVANNGQPGQVRGGAVIQVPGSNDPGDFYKQDGRTVAERKSAQKRGQKWDKYQRSVARFHREVEHGARLRAQHAADQLTMREAGTSPPTMELLSKPEYVARKRRKRRRRRGKR